MSQTETLDQRKARLRALREAHEATLPKPPTPTEIAAAKRVRAAARSARTGFRLQQALIASCYDIDDKTGDAISALFKNRKR